MTCSRGSGSISSVNPISKGLYCKEITKKNINDLMLKTEFSGSDFSF